MASWLTCPGLPEKWIACNGSRYKCCTLKKNNCTCLLGELYFLISLGSDLYLPKNKFLTFQILKTVQWTLTRSITNYWSHRKKSYVTTRGWNWGLSGVSCLLGVSLGLGLICGWWDKGAEIFVIYWTISRYLWSELFSLDLRILKKFQKMLASTEGS